MNSRKKEKNGWKRIATHLIILVIGMIAFIFMLIGSFKNQGDKKGSIVYDRSMKDANNGLENEMLVSLLPARAAVMSYCDTVDPEDFKVSDPDFPKVMKKVGAAGGSELVYAMDADGNVLFSNDKESKPDFEWNDIISDGREVFDVYEVETGEGYASRFVIAFPVFSGEKVIGSVGALLPTTLFNNACINNGIVWNAGNILLSKEGKVLLSSGTGVFSRGEKIYENPAFSFGDGMTEERFLNELSGNKDGFMHIDISGKEYYVAYSSICSDKWTLLSMVAEDRRQSELKANVSTATQMGMGFLIGFAIFIAFGVMVFIEEYKNSNRSTKKLKNEAETDLLTGVYNKLSTEKYIREYMENDGRSGFFYIIDVDDFKKVNDTFGHAFGDEVLKAIGKRLNSQFRATDIIGRLGGDEFCVFLKNLTNEEEKQRQITRMAETFKGLSAGEYVKYNPTASIGGAEYPKCGKTFEEIYKAADRALYEVKKNGKNGLRIYERGAENSPAGNPDGQEENG